MELKFDRIEGELYIVNRDGLTLPYHRKFLAYLNDEYKAWSWKYEFFSDWLELSNTKRKKLADCFKNSSEWFDTAENYPMKECTYGFKLYRPDSIVSIANCPAQEAPLTPKLQVEYKNPEVKKGSTMYYDDCDCCEVRNLKAEVFSPEKRYFLSRVNEISSDHRVAAHKTYNMEPVDPPQTLNEIVDKIKKDQFTIKNNAGDKTQSYQGGFMLVYSSDFSWSTVPPDASGYSKAMDAIEAASDAANDAIVAGDAAAGKAAIDAFAAQTF